MSDVRLVFTPYDPALWTEGDETSRTDCAWHAQTNELHTDACSGELLWTVEMPDGRRFSACEKAGHDILRAHAKRL